MVPKIEVKTTSVRRGRPKPFPPMTEAQSALVRALFVEVGKLSSCDNYQVFNDLVRPIRQEIRFATGWHCWPEIWGAWSDLGGLDVSPIPLADRQRLAATDSLALQRMAGVVHE
jgi:hypothetical protein